MWGKSPDYQITFFSRCTEDFAVHSVTPCSRKKTGSLLWQPSYNKHAMMFIKQWGYWENNTCLSTRCFLFLLLVCALFLECCILFVWIFNLKNDKWIFTGRRWTSTAPMTAPMIKFCIHMYTLSITFNIAVERGRYNVLVYYSVILN